MPFTLGDAGTLISLGVAVGSLWVARKANRHSETIAAGQARCELLTAIYQSEHALDGLDDFYSTVIERMEELAEADPHPKVYRVVAKYVAALKRNAAFRAAQLRLRRTAISVLPSKKVIVYHSCAYPALRSLPCRTQLLRESIVDLEEAISDLGQHRARRRRDPFAIQLN